MACKLLAFLRLSRPLFLLGGVLLYALGALIARYQGSPIDLGIGATSSPSPRLGAYFYSSPPLTLSTTGYGELWLLIETAYFAAVSVVGILAWYFYADSRSPVTSLQVMKAYARSVWEWRAVSRGRPRRNQVLTGPSIVLPTPCRFTC